MRSTTTKSKTDNLLRRIYQTAVDPVRFVREVLRDDPWPVQEEILRSVANHTQTAVKACHSSGKTRIAAAVMLWWIARFKDGIAVTTAPTREQVQKLLWGEVHKAIKRSRLSWPAPNRSEIRLGAGNYATGLSTDRGINFQGFHSGHLLIVIDEAPGVDAEIWEAIEGARAGGEVHILALGNPTIPGGPFHAAFTSERDLWKTFSIDAFDTPNFEGFTLEDLRGLPPGIPESAPVFQYRPRPYLVTRRWAYEKFWTWQERSPMWQSRVRGQFPEQAEDALLSLAWLEAAAKREPHDDGSKLRAGIDVAGPGEDETVIVIRCVSSIIAQRAWSEQDPRGAALAFLAPYRHRLTEVNVDSAGIGYGFALHLEDHGYPVNFVNVGGATNHSERYFLLKGELYWGLRQRFQDGDIAGLSDQLTTSQLATLRYSHNARGQIVIESKEEMRKRGVKSPDRAEAVMLAFANRTPGIIEYYRDLALGAAPGGGIGSAGDGVDDLAAVYEANQLSAVYEEALCELRGELHCADCKSRLNVTSVHGTDGRWYHPSCWDQPGRGRC
jgi:phage terminase large subunit